MRWKNERNIFFFPCVIWYFCLSVCTSYFNSSSKKKKKRRRKNTYAISQNPFSQIGWIDRPVHSTEEDWIEKSIQEYICFIISIPLFIYISSKKFQFPKDWNIYIFELLLWILYQKRYFKGPFVHQNYSSI